MTYTDLVSRLDHHRYNVSRNVTTQQDLNYVDPIYVRNALICAKSPAPAIRKSRGIFLRARDGQFSQLRDLFLENMIIEFSMYYAFSITKQF